eukprot:14549796-Heterocapsa_arctica.AAC.1
MEMAGEVSPTEVGIDDPVNVVFADIKKAHPRVIRSLLYQTIGKLGVPERLVNIVQGLCDHT